MRDNEPGRMTSINQRNYENAAVVQEYRTTTLRPAEVIMFVKYRDEISGRRVIDLGCGAGRVTSYLARWSPHVTGIDSSRAMIDYCTRTYPHIAFALCDARDLSRFPDGSFDVATFTFNGMDTLSHESRLLAFAEIGRMLSPGGLFIFSTHNRRYRHARAEPRLRFHWNPVTFLGGTARFGRAVANRRARKALERDESEYALINDNAHDFSMLHYYIDREAQQQQLEHAGFTLLEVYGEDGSLAKPGDDDSASRELYYVTRHC
jgi:SAM-dependent methyltransferase